MLQSWGQSPSASAPSYSIDPALCLSCLSFALRCDSPLTSRRPCSCPVDSGGRFGVLGSEKKKACVLTVQFVDLLFFLVDGWHILLTA